MFLRKLICTNPPLTTRSPANREYSEGFSQSIGLKVGLNKASDDKSVRGNSGGEVEAIPVVGS